MELSWEPISNSDITSYALHRIQGDDNKILANIPAKKNQQTAYTYTDDYLNPAQTYSYYVEASDKYGNISISDTVTGTPIDKDSYPPVANAGHDLNSMVGIESAFDGSGSYDNDMIASYMWDFGDGETEDSEKAVHVYEAAGDYTVTLTTVDRSGNESKDTITAHVMTPSQAGSIKLRVLDSDNGLPLSYASVYVDFPNQPLLCQTDRNGEVIITGEPGEYGVAAYIKDYMPKEEKLTITKLITENATIALEKGELIVGSVTTKRLTLKEIEAKQIDVSNPANQHVYSFEVTLTFQEKPLPPILYTINGIGNILSGGGSAISLISESGKEIGKAIPQVVPVPDHPEVPPTIAFLKMSASTSFLKEFFEVSVVMKNMADPQFVLANSVAKLNLPIGLALAPTYKTQSLTAQIGSIYGGQEVSRSWIVRGDEPGDYDLTVDYSGTLMPFKAPVTAVFGTETPLTVNGARGLNIYLYPYDAALPGEPYLLPFEIKNESDVTFNMVSLKIDGHSLDTSGGNTTSTTSTGNGTDYVFEDISGLEEAPFLVDGDSVTIKELFPGESLALVYSTAFDVDGELDEVYYKLIDSFSQTLSGSTVSIPVYIEPVGGMTIGNIAKILAAMKKRALEDKISGFVDALMAAACGIGAPLSMPQAEANRKYNTSYIQSYNHAHNISGAIYIYNQQLEPIASTKMGAFGNGADNGCGIVATYNALRILGKPSAVEDIIYTFDTWGGPLLGGVAGTNPLTVRGYFALNGYTVESTYLPGNMDDSIKNSEVTILLYKHSTAVHYVAVKYDNSRGEYLVYNAFSNDTKENKYSSFDNEFIKSNPYIPFEIITIKK